MFHCPIFVVPCQYWFTWSKFQGATLWQNIRNLISFKMATIIFLEKSQMCVQWFFWCSNFSKKKNWTTYIFAPCLFLKVSFLPTKYQQNPPISFWGVSVTRQVCVWHILALFGEYNLLCIRVNVLTDNCFEWKPLVIYKKLVYEQHQMIMSPTLCCKVMLTLTFDFVYL